MKGKVNISIVGFIYVITVLLSVAVVVRIIQLQFFAESNTEESYGAQSRNETIDGIRGNILAEDGRYLAVSTPYYRLYMDCTVAADSAFYTNVGPLSERLAEFYGDKSAREYEKRITDARKDGRRYVRINQKLLTHDQMQELKTFPLFNLGQARGGVIIEKFDQRDYPYPTLGRRTLGFVKAEEAGGARVGLEGSFDNVLRGKPGSRPMRKTEGKEWIPDIDKPTIPAVDGLDIVTTINVDIQDIADRALRKRLSDTDELEGGTVVVMEVATGAIRAMVNLQKTDNGGFAELDNYAIERRSEPGSVFKLATLVSLIEDKHLSLDKELKAVPHWNYMGTVFEDHYLNSYNTISVQRGFEISSNNVFRMLAAQYYDKKPEQFISKLNDLKIVSNIDFDLHEMVNAQVKSPSDPSWSPVDLPQIAMGYTVAVTPLHTLTFYNAIANGGKMMKPYLVEKFSKGGQDVKTFKPEVISVVCSKNTCKEVHKALRGVVENGTGRTVFNGCPVEVSGKTGTAQIVDTKTGRYVDANGRKQHQATFVGFFPSESPKYSVIAVMYSVKTSRNFYGATWGGPVVREVAENLYASSPQWNDPLTRQETAENIIIEKISQSNQLAQVNETE